MRLRALQKVASAGRTLAGAVVAAAAMRFAVVAVGGVMAESDVPPQAAPASSASGATSATSARGRGQPMGSSAPAGTPIQAQLLVNVGTDRSEVYVDGSKLGSSPYVGTISCVAGSKVQIEVVITKGVVYAYERTCEPGMIRVDAAP